MSRGRRYDPEPQLNLKKVFAVIVAIIVIIMFIYIIKGFFGDKKDVNNDITSKKYFSCFKDDKWGVIDEKANIVIDPGYQEMIVIPNKNNDIFLCTYDVNYENGEYKTKALNSKNQEIFLEYDLIEAIPNKDDANNLWYEEDVLRVKKNEKYGLISYENKKILDFEYDSIIAIEGVKNVFKIEKEGKYGIANSKGTILVEPKYEDVKILGKDDKSGFIIKDKGLYGVIDYSSKEILETKYEEIYNINYKEKYYIKEDGIKKVINKEGKEILRNGFDEILQLSEEGIIYKKNNKVGLKTYEGETKIKPEYEDLLQVKENTIIAKKDGKYGVIDLEGNKKIDFKYVNLQYESKPDILIADNENFESDIINSNYEVKLQGMIIDINIEEGYLKIIKDSEKKYYTFKFEERTEKEILKNNTLFVSKKNDKYGFSDKEGKIVVEEKYEEVTEQNQYGYAGIKKDGKWGVVNNKGEIIQEPTYDLENYLVVDFIGRWHLGQEINMNYYNQK